MFIFMAKTKHRHPSSKLCRFKTWSVKSYIMFNMEYDYIVIGAGASGLSFTALMEKRGYKVALLESHSIAGGCSSYFEREGNTFDAGATTLAGLSEGRPLAQLIHQLDLKLNLIKIDPGLIACFPEKKIHRYGDEKKWRLELREKFPNIKHDKIWNKIEKVNQQGWSLSKTFKRIPIQKFSDFFQFLNIRTLKALGSLPNLFTSVHSQLKLDTVLDKDYLAMINELLFITAQNTSQETPMLMGAMGLSYPNDTYYAEGGMKSFINEIAKRCSHLFLNHKVLKINKADNVFEVQTSKGIFKAHNLVSTLPIGNHLELFSDSKIKKYFQDKLNSLTLKCWSAFMIYLTVPVNHKRLSLYYQIHCDPIPHCQTQSFFVSFSHPDFAKSGRQSVTISTHTDSDQWFNMDKENYIRAKIEISDFILETLSHRLEIEKTEMQNIMTGSPKTFFRYTKRYRGLVGGIPHSLKRNPLDILFYRTPLKNFYCLGDNQFPGQGIASVVLGAQNLVARLCKD